MKYAWVKQLEETDCGAACLATLCRHFGKNVSLSVIREMGKTDQFGTTMLGLYKAADQLGFNAEALEGAADEFLSSNLPLPCIAHVVLENSREHYVVVHKITGRHVIIADPAAGVRRLTREAFSALYAGHVLCAVPSERFASLKSRGNTLWGFAGLLKPQAGLLAKIFFVSILATVAGILTTFVFENLMDKVLPEGAYQLLAGIMISVCSLYVVKHGLDLLRSMLLARLSCRLNEPMMEKCYRHIIRLPMSFFSSRKMGDVISRLNDASQVCSAISGAALTILIDSVMLIIGGVVVFCQNKLLFCLATAVMLLNALVAFCFRNRIRTVNRDQLEAGAAMESHVIESLSCAETIKAESMEQHVSDKMSRLLNITTRIGLRSARVTSVQEFLCGMLAALGEMIILWCGVMQIRDGALTIGALITFTSLLDYYISPLSNLINLLPSLQSAMASADRLMDLMELQPEESDEAYSPAEPSLMNEGLHIRNLNFAYGYRRSILKNVDLDVKKGEKIALVGESGSGKSTLMRLLMGFFPVENGDVHFGSRSIRDFAPAALRRNIGYIPQHVRLFQGSIYENIACGRDIPMSRVEAVCAEIGLDRHVKDMPFGYDSAVYENGENLSGGQRQLIAIARAVADDPELLLIDEATSGMDAATENLVQHALERITRSKTCIYIAHRLKTIRNCDNILVFSGGSVVEQGSHDALIEQGGSYADLWNRQFA